MSAPGNSALIVVLLAVFVACCAYAAGRLHQRYQMKSDREEAYRDGYDTATRSVFSLAARIIAPRRAVRGAAAVKPVVSSPAPSPPVESPPDLPAPEPLPVRVPAPPPAEDSSFGFPAPPPPPARLVAEPAAVGGLVFRPFPDPRQADGSEPLMGDPSSMPAPRRHRSEQEAAADSGSTGRHTVPDELVQAATYRLPADRVFRAKVPDPAGTPALPEEPTTRLSVPKPRQS